MTLASNVSIKVQSETQLLEVVSSGKPTISVFWDKVVQQLVIDSAVGPTIASNSYALMHTAMYDAWSAYDPTAISTTSGDKMQQTKEQMTMENKLEAMSVAAFDVLHQLFPSGRPYIQEKLKELGLRPFAYSTTPAEIGRSMASAVLGKYSETSPTDYVEDLYRNAPFTNSVDRWTAERIPIDDPDGPIQEFLTPEWGRRFTFGVENGRSGRPVPPEPFLLVNGEVDLEEKRIKLENGTYVPVSRDLIGTIINPRFILQTEEVIEFSRNLTDRTKLIAEFWEDGGGTSFPPGTWMTFGQYVSARDGHTLDDDVKMFLALSNAVSDAGITTWNAKLFYFYARPVRVIRSLGHLGLIGEYDEELGGYAITAYSLTNGKVMRLLAENWETYQTPGDHPSPPFAEYTSGHSAFSSSGATVLKLFTGSDHFGASITIKPGESRFEPGMTPRQEVTLEWNTFSEAAVEAGISRLHGGIHFKDGNVNGKTLGDLVGEEAFKAAMRFISGAKE